MNFINLGEQFGTNPLLSACSESGAIVFVADPSSSTLYKSTNFGVSFVGIHPVPLNIYGLACSSDASIVYLSYGNILRKSIDGGATFIDASSGLGSFALGIACSDDGSLVYSCDNSSDTIRKSVDYGATFVDMGINVGGTPQRVACSSDGLIVYVASGNRIYMSIDGGASYSTVFTNSVSTQSISCSSDGSISYVADTSSLGVLRSSIDYGNNYEIIYSGFGGATLSNCTSSGGDVVYVTGVDVPALFRTDVLPNRTTKLIPEDIEDIVTGDLLVAENKADIVTGDLLGAENKADIVTGDLLPANAKIDIVTGALLTAIPLPPTSGFPLNYARIGYDNALVNGSASATSDSVNAAKMLTPSTYDKWRPTADSVATLVGTLKQCNYIGIAAHNLGADGVTLTVKVSDGGAYTTVYSQLVTTDNALFIRFAEGAYSNVELTLTGSLTAEIGVVFLGLELEMMRPIFTGHKPANLNATDVMTPQVSDGGQFLGKQIVRQGYATAADFQHLTDEWYRDKFQPFVEHAKVRPYFWAWNLLESPDDIVYGWTNSNIGCSYMGIKNWLQVSFDIEAHA